MKPHNIPVFPSCFTALFAFLVLAASAVSGFAANTKPSAKLEVMAETNELFWNAVAIDGDRIFVSGPRAFLPEGSTAPALGVLAAHGKPVPYPDQAWNAWKPGADPAKAFVNVNAIHLDGRGALWVIDSGTPAFGGEALPGAPKAVKINLTTNRVEHVYAFGPDVAFPGSYMNDIRFNGDNAYLTDAGQGAIVVLDLKTGWARRTLEKHPSTLGTRPIIVEGKPLSDANDKPIMVNADPLDLSPDGKWLYYAPAGGPWSAIETKWLDNPALSAAEVAAHVFPWADLPPTGGSAMDANGDFYYSELAAMAVKKRTAAGEISTLVQDPRLHWVDAPAIDAQGYIWFPVPQIDRAAAFNHGKSRMVLPVQLFRLKIR